MQQTGAAAYLTELVVGRMGTPSAPAILAGLFLLTAAITQVLPTPAVVVLLVPIAINTAQIVGFSPQALAMVVAVSAAGTSLNPVAHPANSLVMGPGGYRFTDFLKVGLPLIAVILAVVLLVLPLFWPL
jgi:di/tricarboxylate transporter